MLLAASNWITYTLLGLSPVSRWGAALNFFIYDSTKIVFLLFLMVYVISYLRSFFPPERTKQILARYNRWVGYGLAALLGTVTPFCSCSSVPIFIGFVESGISLGATFAFLISSPMVNEVAIVMLGDLFGWSVAIAYVLLGLVLAIIGGFLIDTFHLEHLVEDYVYRINVGKLPIEKLTAKDRHRFAWENTLSVVRSIWLWVLVGVGVGALIHGYAPESLLVSLAGRGNPFAVPVAVAIGIPLYSNDVGVIPVAQALITKGVGLGTALAFMMSTVTLSVPQMVLLRKVLKPKLLAIFVGIVAIGMVLVGYFFNILWG
jgi:uncharacterized membrane protein YraQ (UPF0718 family)